ncbi:hypothetical protein WOLCODRAFT_146790 [Wolfiporia cocos MD-104 SS10]|uniref:DUF6533 domain-containing protein n=1 Tax=Wolfiporia cocos (strain MD-104) TaxID=742152 RepID=A0A2H3JAK5_WOLCO|nr:hypothetical protein WOLCODRAFT_146790 [Wolfiporia cocos MD-104 SS10]
MLTMQCYSNLESYCISSGCALILYDYSLTLSQEIQLMWNKTSQGNTALFLMNRCVMISIVVSYIFMVPWVDLTNANLPISVAERMIFLVEVATDASLAMWAVVSAFRVYAVSHRCWSLAILTLLLGSAPLATNLTLEARSYFFVDNALVDQLEHLSTSTISKLGLAARICLIISDALVITITWYMLHNHETRLALAQRRLSLSQLLIRDGTLNFTLLLVLNVIGVVLNNLQVTYGFVYLTDAATTVLISRLMLNLRGACFEPDDPTGYQLGTVSSNAPDGTLQFQPQTTGWELHSVASTSDIHTTSTNDPALSGSTPEDRV